MNRPKLCSMNTQTAQERSEGVYEYVPCRKPATWFTDDFGGARTVWLCDKHQEEAARDNDMAEFYEERS